MPKSKVGICMLIFKPFYSPFLKKSALTLIIPGLCLAMISADVNFKNPGPPINSAGDDYHPTLNKEGTILIFSSKRGPQKYQKLYEAKLVAGKWQKPRMLSEIASPYNDETPFMSNDGNLLIFASDRDGSKEMPKNEKGQIRVSNDLYMSKRKSNGKFGPPIPLPGAVNTIHHERSPVISEDGQTLYFTRWAFGSIKGSKLYQASWTGKTFTAVKELPAPINTGHQELGLTISQDKKGVYFSSTRPGGYGGWDIYYAAFKGKGFDKPENLGDKINSKDNELYLTWRGRSLYFCSNRADGMGRYDILGDFKQAYKRHIQVYDKISQNKIPANLKIENKEKTNQSSSKFQSSFSASDGNLVFEVPPNVKQAAIKVFSPGYLPYVHQWDQSHDQIPEEIFLEKLEANKSFTLHAIHFDFDSASIRPESHSIMDQLAEYMKAQPKLKFQIIGHTDRRGESQYNMGLSLKRAQSVKNYLVKSGITSGRLTVDGMGYSKPLSRQNSSAADALNRRTEFKVLSVN